MTTYKDAGRLKGILIVSGPDNFFRMHDKDSPEGFKDYQIFAGDISITIDPIESGMLELIEEENGNCYLDHSRRVLGTGEEK